MANKRICISNETFGEWQQLRKELCIQNDSLLACFCYLLSFLPCSTLAGIGTKHACTFARAP